MSIFQIAVKIFSAISSNFFYRNQQQSNEKGSRGRGHVHKSSIFTTPWPPRPRSRAQKFYLDFILAPEIEITCTKFLNFSLPLDPFRSGTPIFRRSSKKCDATRIFIFIFFNLFYQTLLVLLPPIYYKVTESPRFQIYGPANDFDRKSLMLKRNQYRGRGVDPLINNAVLGLCPWRKIKKYTCCP